MQIFYVFSHISLSKVSLFLPLLRFRQAFTLNLSKGQAVEVIDEAVDFSFVGVVVGIDGDRADTQLLKRPYYANGNLAAGGDKHLMYLP